MDLKLTSELPQIPYFGVGFPNFGLKSPKSGLENPQIFSSNPLNPDLPLWELPGASKPSSHCKRVNNFFVRDDGDLEKKNPSSNCWRGTTGDLKLLSDFLRLKQV
jgi:hypothetical protein